MWECSALSEEPPGTRLERWLVGVLREGGLRSLPEYSSPALPTGQCPERFARALLTGLKSTGGDRRRLERLKDDGRAFRSWAESAGPGRYNPPMSRFAS